MFKLEFSTDSDAFSDNSMDRQYEIARILRELAAHIEGSPSEWLVCRIRDLNGNHIGDWSLEVPDLESGEA